MGLPDLAEEIKSILKWFLISLAVLFALWVIWIIIRNVSGLVFKPRGVPTAYGQISPPLFTKTLNKLEATSFQLAIDLPKSREEVDIYKISIGERFVVEQQNKIANYFPVSNSRRTQVGNTIYIKDPSGLSEFVYKISENTFTYRYRFSQDKTLTSSRVSLDRKKAISLTLEILNKLAVRPPDIDDDKALVRYVKLSGNQKVESTPQEANAVEIIFYRKLSISSIGQAPIRAILAGSGSVVEFDYFYKSKEEIGSPYPLLTATQAWDEFKKGKSFSENVSKFVSVSVSKMFLAYWESKNFQPYLQPVWVFEGNGKTEEGKEFYFQALLPAITSSFLK